MHTYEASRYIRGQGHRHGHNHGHRHVTTNGATIIDRYSGMYEWPAACRRPFLVDVLTRRSTVNIVQQGTVAGTRLYVNVTRHSMLTRMCRTPIALLGTLFDTRRLDVIASVAMDAGSSSSRFCAPATLNDPTNSAAAKAGLAKFMVVSLKVDTLLGERSPPSSAAPHTWLQGQQPWLKKVRPSAEDAVPGTRRSVPFE